jgi:hypothetical protein
MAKQSMITLASGVVIDKSFFVTETADNMCDIISTISQLGKPVLVVDDATTFFTVDNLVKMVQAKDGRYNLVADYLSAHDNAIVALQDRGELPAGDVVVKRNKGGPIGYQLAAVPQGWTIATDVSLGQTKIKRKRMNSFGDGTTFYLPPVEFEKLCVLAITRWAKGEAAAKTGEFTTSNGRRTATVEGDRVTFGHETIRRFEIEWIAKYRHWFPKNLAA